VGIVESFSATLLLLLLLLLLIVVVVVVTIIIIIIVVVVVIVIVFSPAERGWVGLVVAVVVKRVVEGLLLLVGFVGVESAAVVSLVFHHSKGSRFFRAAKALKVENGARVVSH
jgi:hypothetical protein